ncbi:hypothetical protein BGW80DRAFT_1322027, partial [Lactifluus volemus]
MCQVRFEEYGFHGVYAAIRSADALCARSVPISPSPHPPGYVTMFIWEPFPLLPLCQQRLSCAGAARVRKQRRAVSALRITPAGLTTGVVLD